MEAASGSSALGQLLESIVAEGHAPGLVGLIDGPGGRVVASAGVRDPGAVAPLRPDAIFRLSSVTKPIVAAAVMSLVDDGTIALDAPVHRWLPELSAPMVLRSPGADPADVVPADRPILVEDLLTFRAGYGFPDDFSLPWVQQLVGIAGGAPAPRLEMDADRWIGELARLPLLHQPGRGWLYHTASDLQGVLIARAADRPLDQVLRERLLDPLSMSDTGFHIPAADAERCVSVVQLGPGGYTVTEAGAGEWTRPARFASGSSGLVSTVADWAAFARMLVAGGCGPDGRRVLSQRAVAAMTSDHTTAAERLAAEPFLDGQGWGYGGSVDIVETEPWRVVGRYGWTGAVGTAAYVVPATGVTAILFGQAALTGPGTPDYMARVFELARVHGSTGAHGSTRVHGSTGPRGSAGRG